MGMGKINDDKPPVFTLLLALVRQYRYFAHMNIAIVNTSII
jgi:hypothetical protein